MTFVKRLIGPFAQVNNGQTLMGKSNVLIVPHRLIVRTAVLLDTV
jgi:hypothetical protein